MVNTFSARKASNVVKTFHEGKIAKLYDLIHLAAKQGDTFIEVDWKSVSPEIYNILVSKGFNVIPLGAGFLIRIEWK